LGEEAIEEEGRRILLEVGNVIVRGGRVLQNVGPNNVSTIFGNLIIVSDTLLLDFSRVMADCVYCTPELDSNTMSTCHLLVKQPILSVEQPIFVYTP
jgi:hypothetical protein